MNSIHDKILTMTDDATTGTVRSCITELPGLELLTADSENQAFKMIYNHTLVLVIIDEALSHIEPYRIGSMLMSLKQIHNTPLLILCDTAPTTNFLKDFDALQADHLLRPFTQDQIRAKIKLFFELFKQKNAVHQSIDELDRVYQKIVAQHEAAIKEDAAVKALSTRAASAAGQIQQPLRSLRGNLYHLLRGNFAKPAAKPRLAAIKTASEQITMAAGKLTSLPAFYRAAPSARSYKILYVQGSGEDFSIFNHFMKSVINCKLFQAGTVEESLELVIKEQFELIFIDHILSDGTGLDLLARLNRMRCDIPVIFTLDKSYASIGPQAVSKGAFSYLLKEELSGTHILSIIHDTLEKASLTREVEDARSRIVMIARKDFLTKLYNRRRFERTLESELSKAQRYSIQLSVLLINFDRFETVNRLHGYETGDKILTTAAGIIQGMVRKNDVVCRYGAEKFGIVLPNTTWGGAGILARRIQKKMTAYEFGSGGDPPDLAVSIGVAAFDPKTDATCSDLVKKALNALAAKQEQVDSKRPSPGDKPDGN